jgi:NitT/TauT family transport system substrate-binding protein
MKLMTGYIGLELGRDILVNSDFYDSQLYLDGKIDAFVAFPTALPALRKRSIGHTIASSVADRPWSQYYCCLLAVGTDFLRRYPVATKRMLRAILKSTDLCAREPERVARMLAERGFSYDDTLQVWGDMRYDIWRDYDPEDTLRFYALRMNEVGITKSLPQELIARHSDWRFVNELKRELKT